MRNVLNRRARNWQSELLIFLVDDGARRGQLRDLVKNIAKSTSPCGVHKYVVFFPSGNQNKSIILLLSNTMSDDGKHPKVFQEVAEIVSDSEPDSSDSQNAPWWSYIWVSPPIPLSPPKSPQLTALNRTMTRIALPKNANSSRSSTSPSSPSSPLATSSKISTKPTSPTPTSPA